MNSWWLYRRVLNFFAIYLSVSLHKYWSTSTMEFNRCSFVVDRQVMSRWLKATTSLRINWIPKIMDYFLLSKTIFRLWNCFLSSVATGGKDGHGLKLGEVGPTFSSFNHAMPAIKLKTKTLLWLALPDNFVWYMFSAGKCMEGNPLSFGSTERAQKG